MPLTPGSLVACRSTASASARLILSWAAANRADPTGSPFSRPSILPVTCIQGQPSLRLHCSKSALRCQVLATVFSINTSPGSCGTILRGPLHPNLIVECNVTAIGRPWNSSSSERSASHLSDWGILLMFAERVLIAVPCSVTTTASDDESWPACTGSSLRILEQVCCPFGHAASAVASFRRCRCRTCSSSTQHIPPSYRTFDAPAGLAFLPLAASLRERPGFLLGEIVRFPLPTNQSPARAHVIWCLR